eukprot:scpid18904/ scgid31380/ GDP-fucose protein O-fucosyltransferase 1; Peptide-O-fucosyltransferase 1; GDP-fucose protein O-fucosyltransferase 1; Peptide-O-fucosyltransferase 1
MLLRFLWLLVNLGLSLASHGLGDAGDSFNTAGAHGSLKVGEALPEHIDPNGYVLYCPCMGRFGNQAEQLLGTLAFVKDLNRTYVVPPFVVYPPEGRFPSERRKFTELFSLKELKKVHRAITMEEFFRTVAPVVWPKGSRIGHCRSFPGNKGTCNHKNGNPFGPFWDHFGVEFDSYDPYDHLPYGASSPTDKAMWDERFPADQVPVIALPGAVGSFPMLPEYWPLQKVFQWSSTVTAKVKKFLKDALKDKPFVGIHLRNGADWSNACAHVKTEQRHSYMASLQCTHETTRQVTWEMCLPKASTVLKDVKKALKKTKAKYLFVATDSDPMLEEFNKHLKSLKVTVVTYEPSNLHMELAILQRAEHFVGNCVSSVSSFVTRHRLLSKKPTSFFGVS